MATQHRYIARIAFAFFGSGVAWLAAAAYVSINDGFGAGDLRPFAFWCGIFAGYTYLAWQAASAFVSRGPVAWRISKAVIAGAALAALFTFAVALGTGPWIGAYSFPIGLLWVLGGVGAFVIGTLYEGQTDHHSSRRGLVSWGVGLAATAALPIVLVLGDAFLWGRARPERYEVPPAFQGSVTVVYDVPGAPALGLDAGVRVIPVPASGVVVTSSPDNPGWKKPAVYYALPDSLVEVMTDWARMDDSTQRVRAYWLPQRGRVTVNGVQEPFMTYEAFAVGPPDQDDGIWRHHQEVLDSLWRLYAR